jgi:hypothetical protein
MNKKTQQIVGALAILGLGYWAYTKYGKKKSFTGLNIGTSPSGAGISGTRETVPYPTGGQPIGVYAPKPQPKCNPLYQIC